MKKAVKAIIAASAVAAVVGIGAVSFAAWTATTHGTANASGQIGTIEAYGFDSALNASMESGKKLVPYNQTGTDSSWLKVWSVELPKVTTTTTGAKLTVNYGTTAPTLNPNSGIYVMWSASTVSSAPANTTGYKKLSTSAQDLGKTFSANSASVSGGYLVVILDSSASGDMGASFSIVVTVEKTT